MCRVHCLSCIWGGGGVLSVGGYRLVATLWFACHMKDSGVCLAANRGNCRLGLPNSQCRENIRNSCITAAVLGARMEAKWLHSTCCLRVPNVQRGDNVRNGCLTPAIRGPHVGTVAASLLASRCVHKNSIAQRKGAPQLTPAGSKHYPLCHSLPLHTHIVCNVGNNRVHGIAHQRTLAG